MLQWPANISPEGADEMAEWLMMAVRKIKRHSSDRARAAQSPAERQAEHIAEFGK